jgi:type IV secretion system protein VirD4
MNLSAKHGIILGKNDKGEQLIADGYQHVLLLAPAGAGKGVSFVLPNLLFWQESAIVHDIKCENYELTSGWRASRGQEIFVWNPLSPTTHRYNPLDSINSSPDQMVTDIQQIAYLLIPGQGPKTSRARSLLVATILYLSINADKQRTLGEVVRVLMHDVSADFENFKDKMHPAGAMAASSFLSLENKKRAKVVDLLLAHLEPWTNPAVDHATSASDFNIADFKKRKITLYVGLHPEDIRRLQPLMRFFYEHAATQLMRGSDEAHGVLFFMDEFHTLGEMDTFASFMPYFRGYKIRLFLIAQDLGQMNGCCGEVYTDTMLSNSTFKIVFATNNQETAHMISELAIDRTDGESLFSAGEIITLPLDKQILLVDGEQPIKLMKSLYYNDPEFKARVMRAAGMKYT